MRGIFRAIKTSNECPAGVRQDGAQIESPPAGMVGVVSVLKYICHAAYEPLVSPVNAARLVTSIQGLEYLEIVDGGQLYAGLELFRYHYRRGSRKVGYT